MSALPTRRALWSVLGIYLALTVVPDIVALLTGESPAIDTSRELFHAALSVIGSWGAVRRSRAATHAALGWRWVAAGLGIVGVHNLATTVFPGLRLGAGTMGSNIAQIFSTLSFPVTAVGIALWPLGSVTRRGRLRKGLNGAVFALSVFFIAWVLGTRDAVLGAPALAVRVFGLFNFALASSMLGLVVYYGSAVPARLRGPLGWVGAAVFTYAGLQVASLALTAHGHASAAALLSLPKLLAFGLMAAAPFSPVSLNGDQPWDDTRETTEGGLVLVYAPALLALTVGVILSIAGRMEGDATAATLAVAIGVTLMLRQFLTVRDFAELSRTLERRVRERTRDLEEAQGALAHAQRMDALGRLAGGVAHDFNNLLTAIRGYAELIVTEEAGHESLRDDAREIARAADRGAALTRQLLTFARKQVPELAVVDLGDAVARVTDLLRRLLPAHIQLSVRRAPEPARVMIDPAQFEQIVVNLAVNARDAMPAGGQLTVETLRLTTLPEAMARDAPSPAGGWAVLRVADSGMGMDAGTLAHIFEPFFTTKPAGSGTGLGLATSYGIARQAGGFIHVQSETGKGSTFDVVLPAVDAEARVGRVTPVGVASAGASQAVVVVEDDPSVREVVGRTMRDLGYRVHLAADVASAATARRQLAGALRLLITDGAPDSDAEREVRGLGETSAPVPVLRLHRATTPAPDRPADGERYLAKPFTQAQLVEAVRQALGRTAGR